MFLGFAENQTNSILKNNFESFYGHVGSESVILLDNESFTGRIRANPDMR